MFGRRKQQPAEPPVMEGRVALWDGWFLDLPTPCRVVRNEDGSWSAFDDSTVVDVSILTVGAMADGRPPLTAEAMLGAPDGAPVREANGCLSYAELHPSEGEPGVLFLTVKAAATMTACYLSVGYRDEAHASWAKAVWGSLTHGG